MKYQTYILFGAPGSGKGTQGRTLGSIPRFFHCACGDVFRSIDTRTKVGRAFLEYSSKGQLVPDYITYSLNTNRHPRLWSANAISIYQWWLARSTAHPLTNPDGSSRPLAPTSKKPVDRCCNSAH